MKKITFLLLTLSLITFKTTAQESKVKFGIHGGLNYSSFRGYRSFTDDSAGFAYLFGFSFQHQIQENLSIKADLNYERKTQISKASVEIMDPSVQLPPGIYEVKSTAYLNYVVLPIMLKYNFSSDKSFYVNAGPYLGYLVKSGIKTKTNIPDESEYDEEDTDNKKSLDFGFSAGIGKEFTLTENHQLYIELRDNLGLSNISKAQAFNNDSLKTNSVNLLVGFTFN
ncbi:porin family protein [Flavobacterium notoginsengisoli]|uniref:porin family protein n=1 Tax=Flavobacterium notoginsengisoli TaxID=1478199 RepID=UPI00362752F9